MNSIFLNKTHLHQLSLVKLLSDNIPSRIYNLNVVFFCIGTDRSTGDSLGPLVGSLLKKNGYHNVMGTLEEPIHAQNLQSKIEEIPKNKTVIVIDSFLGPRENIGQYFVSRGGIEPGLGLGKKLPMVGDYSIKAIVNAQGTLPFQVLQSTRLSLIIKMAEEIAEGLSSHFPLTNRYCFYTDESIKSNI